ncbi:hypothetical protein ILUMI_06550 [Ignelater luminosus]|uniref:PH domain-containing protein n=1 Tax=Ignelater luminosus TaxID=2038154 RepID=A0A8K0GIY2_IGNLU|nr:hypothetical protein ILUMI_06550 [Ignelater luminosus]
MSFSLWKHMKNVISRALHVAIEIICMACLVVHGQEEKAVPPVSPTKPTAAIAQVEARAQTMSRAEKEGRRKDRSRSKSPFRSFRWKKSPKTSGAVSDDEAATTEQSGIPDEDAFDGQLVRKHEWENTTTKASNRSWDKVYAVVRGPQLLFYKDAKAAKATPEQTFKGEAALSLHRANASVAQDYKKKKHVFRLKLDSGAEFLLQAHDDADMNNWISRINSQAETDSSGPSRSQTLPASAQKEDSKRRSFFTLKKS